MVNKIKISGRVLTDPVLSEKFKSEEVYEVMLGIKKPFKNDMHIIPVRISNRFNDFSEVQKGVAIEVTGSIRSANKKVDDSSRKRLVISVFCQELKVLNNYEESENYGEYEGEVASEPYFVHATATMPQRCELMVRSTRNYGKYTYLPLTLRGRNAEYASHFKVGEKIFCTGRIQARKYHKRVDGELKEFTTVEFVGQEVDLVVDNVNTSVGADTSSSVGTNGNASTTDNADVADAVDKEEQANENAESKVNASVEVSDVGVSEKAKQASVNASTTDTAEASTADTNTTDTEVTT